MTYVKPKKKLGQHFLTDQNIAHDIVDALSGHGGYRDVLEVGPGTGVLTKILALEGKFKLKVIELDSESVEYLINSPFISDNQIIEGDFLNFDLNKITPDDMAIIGNFPYNISSQIFFKVLDYRDKVQEVTGMIQKEVADRIVAKPGGKTGGILSILLQAYYDVSYLFTVPPEVFNPPPKVQSAVISLKRNGVKKLDCDEKLFKRLVKQGFHNRRKTLRNALKALQIPKEEMTDEIFGKRAEQLSVQDFVLLTNRLAKIMN